MQKLFFETDEKAPKTVIKPIRMVDLNNKKHCQAMVEVNFAPAKRISEKEMQDTVFLITWDDGAQGHYQLVDMHRFTFAEYRNCFTYPSHGMDFCDFYLWFQDQYPKVNAETELAAYFYRKFEDNNTNL